MGLLKNAGEMGVDVDDDTVPEDVQQQIADSVMAPPGPAPEHEPKGEPISVEPAPERKKSRREQATEEAIERRAKEIEDRFARQQQEENRRWEQRLNDIQSALRQQQPVQPVQQQAAASPDPADLKRQAKKALDNKDFEEYERLTQEAVIAESERRMEAKLAKLQPQQQQPQEPPWLVGMRGRYHRVATSPKGEVLLQSKLMELNAISGKVGPELFEEAFQHVDRMLGGSQAVEAAGRPQFSQSSASVLAAVPTSRAATAPTGAKKAGVRLSEWERTVARKFKMSEEDYAAHLAKTHPERVEK